MESLIVREPIERQAIRILFILFHCSDNTTLPMFGDYTHVIETESKLQKIDFWLRYPDHLAAALLRGLEPTGIGSPNLSLRSDEVRVTVRHIFENREPILRWVPMRKYLRGAYEPLDEVMTFLSSRLLAYRRAAAHRRHISYYLTQKGNEAVQRMLAECSETQWYSARCKLINDFFGHLNSFEIRKLQYLEGEYANTPHSQMIDRVVDEVRRRFEKLFGESL
jgi:DNA-binding MarR family transcriptional regulator